MPKMTSDRYRGQKRPSEPVSFPPPLAYTFGRPIPGVPQKPARAVRMGYDVYGRSVTYEVEETIDPGDPVAMPNPVIRYLQAAGSASVTVSYNHRRYLVQIGRAEDSVELRSHVYEVPSMRRIGAREHPRTHEYLVAHAEEQLLELAGRVHERAARRQPH